MVASSGGIVVNAVKYVRLDNNFIHDEVTANAGAGISATGANVEDVDI